MLQLVQEKKTDFGITHKKYDSDIFTVVLSYMDEKLNTVTIYPRKYPFPDILVDIRTLDVRLDFSKIETIPVTKIDRFKENIQKTEQFINDELMPFIATIK